MSQGDEVEQHETGSFERTEACECYPLDTYGVSHFIFVVHFVAKRYILQKKCRWLTFSRVHQP